jgi:hypothetical protein
MYITESTEITERVSEMGKKQLARLASGFVLLLDNPEFYSHLASWRVVIYTLIYDTAGIWFDDYNMYTVVPKRNSHLTHCSDPRYTVAICQWAGTNRNIWGVEVIVLRVGGWGGDGVCVCMCVCVCVCVCVLG